MKKKENVGRIICLSGEKKVSVECIEERILEAKTECYAKDKVKSPPFF